MGESADDHRNPGLPAVLETDHIFDALAHPRRRYLLYMLQTDGQRPLWQLAKQITAWEADVPEETVSEDAVERVFISLYHNHVPMLVCDGIVTAVAEAEGIEPRHLKHPPLFEVVDTVALEAAFFGNQGSSRSHDPNSSTEFMYRDYRVVVRSDGWVQVDERAED